jgi:surfeit locus 1 family protein
VWINRGFVTADRRTDPSVRLTGAAHVTGLLRLSEPGGAFLRRNDPGADRWYSRDVQAISAARHLVDAAPFFVDEDARSEAGTQAGAGAPVGGLTVISFYNNHLVYALTWYTLALMVPAGAWIAFRQRRS